MQMPGFIGHGRPNRRGGKKTTEGRALRGMEHGPSRCYQARVTFTNADGRITPKPALISPSTGTMLRMNWSLTVPSVIATA
jgi:hypothetical protein